MRKQTVQDVSGVVALLAAVALAFLIQTLFPANGSAGAQSYEAAREKMVREQIEARGIRSLAVLDAMRKVERHLFVPEEYRHAAYEDYPLPLHSGQTISQPYIVAYMTEFLKLEPHHKVLEIGTGSGYQAAVLAEIADQVYTIEIVEKLGEEARERLRRLGYDNVHVRIGNGYLGWPEEAPFDRIIVTAAPREMPQTLIDQLAPGGRLVAPVGAVWADQELVLITKDEEGTVKRQSLLPVRFVPMVGDQTFGNTPE